jgi:hypothetical protein
MFSPSGMLSTRTISTDPATVITKLKQSIQNVEEKILQVNTETHSIEHVLARERFQ